ncbi:MAG: mucoidy inhibitor MuiA family protein [Planctomycetota bacterium]|nr:mucoidy inhibitor MuiA family protein [Planctomycetota bacterium]
MNTIHRSLRSLALLSLAAPLAGAADELSSAISDVTLYGKGAIVTRRAPLPVPEGSFVLRGLPSGIDPTSVRVRASGGEVVGVETRRHFREQAGGERLEALRGAVIAAKAGYVGAQDARDVTQRLVSFYERLLTQERAAIADALVAGRADTKRWKQGLRFYEDELGKARSRDRKAQWAVQDARLALEAANAELDGATSTGGAHSWDVFVDVVGRAGMAALEVEYFVGDAGWTPTYDLRAAGDLSSAELVYRAKVWQRTGEDWPEVPILLSTARPELGTRGPEPSVSWVGLYDPNDDVSVAASVRFETLKDLGYAEDGAGLMFYEDAEVEGTWAPTFAGAENAGISVRFRLPRRETVESRELPTTLLVGRATLDIEVEHYAAPSVSERVWLRGRATNTSPWEMLPGEASAYVGADYVGRTWLAGVHPGEDFDMPLGPDAGVSIVRSKVEDFSEGPAFLRSKATELEAWRIVVENFGALGVGAKSPVQVIVQEVLPRSSDERLRVSLDGATPSVSTAERFAKEREEKGILTWVLSVPAEGKAEVVWSREVAWPKDLVITGK